MQYSHKQDMARNEIEAAQALLKQPPNKRETSDAVNIVSLEKLHLLNINDDWRSKEKSFHCPLCIQWFSLPACAIKLCRTMHHCRFTFQEIVDAQVKPTELNELPSKVAKAVTQKQMQSLKHQR